MNAAEFLAWNNSLGPYSEWSDEVREERTERFKLLSPADKYTVQRGDIDKFFVPENAQTEKQSTHKSPSGKYLLRVTPYRTREGAWNYTLGEIYRVEPASAEPVKVADVRRNYGSMIEFWVEGHPFTGQDYLVTGEDYQGFTVVNLTTGKVTTHIPDDAFEGYGWCPVTFQPFPMPDTSKFVLKVSGCYWACPYEVRFYDFSNPDAPDFFENGLPWLTKGLWLEDEEGARTLSVEADGSLVLTENAKRFKATGEWADDIDQKRYGGEREYRAKKLPEPEQSAELAAIRAERDAYNARYDEDNDDLWESVPDKREVYVLVDGVYKEAPERSWLSERALAEERVSKEWEEKSNAEFKHYREAEPLYQLVKATWPEDYLSRTGRMSPSQVNRWDGDDNPFYFRVRVGPEGGRQYTATLEWGATSGAVKAVCFTSGKGEKATTFPRTGEGWREALAFARAHLGEQA